jgi:hypothetical protein
MAVQVFQRHCLIHCCLRRCLARLRLKDLGVATDQSQASFSAALPILSLLQPSPFTVYLSTYIHDLLITDSRAHVLLVLSTIVHEVSLLSYGRSINNGKEKDHQMEEVDQKTVIPARYPRFPALTPQGAWEEWVPDPVPPPHPSYSVVKPPLIQPYLPQSTTPGLKEAFCTLHYALLPADHIRLLSLRDTRLEHGVLCGIKIVTVALSSAPEYEALSYCWGSTDSCTGLFISTEDSCIQVCRVTENLATCLHSVVTSPRPDQKESGYLWVDQICINQNDVAERNAQVRRMADIYKIAARVIIWLGQVTEFDINDVILDLQPGQDREWRGSSIFHWVQQWTIFARPWFFRQWIFQEAVFGRQLLVLLGTDFRTWKTMEYLHKTLDPLNEEDIRGDYPFESHVMNGFLKSIIDRTRRDMRALKPTNLGALLRPLRIQQCQDPRDKIFSLVGLAEDVLPADLVDYTQPIEAISQRCTRSVLVEHH